jgi:phage terminase large subunit-like protein
MSQGKLHTGGNPILAWCADNVVMTEDALGRRKPDKMKARERIDGISALLSGMKRYMLNAGTEVEWTAE